MGSETYKFILGTGIKDPYPDCEYPVVSRKRNFELKNKRTSFMDEDWLDQIHRLKKEEGKDIWLVGGGKLIASFLDQDLIDEMIISLIPLILGDGFVCFRTTLRRPGLN